MTSEHHLRRILHEHDMKSTKVRLLVLDLLLGSGTAMSHNQVSERLSEHAHEIDKVTLYRTLNTFVEKGLAHKVDTADRNWLYAIYNDDASHAEDEHEHAHFICISCEKVYCFPIDEQVMSVRQQDMQGFEVKQTEIRLHGRCPVCQ